ncbi:MAG: Unknown protein [uncultured Sulfurovum sp.]|uniref:Uncharacterized protein n=1 Tax=uncultured Sulfurovum sp. TaxID=269237 RepID=A0A6S6TFB8_9BACT|nr:MAG: Unknown protein [uncultured Sulfurovum sp.]
MNQEKAFLFITFTSGQNFFIKQIIKQYQYKNYFIITTTEAKEFNNFNKKRILTLEKINGLKSISFNRKRMINNFLIDIEEQYSDIEIFVAHFLNILTNHIYNRYKKHKHIIFSSFPDGMLTFNEYKITYLNFESLKKKILSKLLGLDYTVIHGSINNPFNNILYVYSHLSRLTPCSNNQVLKDIKFPQYQKINGNNSIILGHANQKKKISLDDSFYKRFKNKNKIYYKPHPRCELNNDLFYLALKEKLTIEVLNTRKPIETIIEEFHIRYVFAVASSALVNLKLLFNDIECFSFSLNTYIETKYINIYLNIFNELNIQILKNNNKI